jgi:hypothetical protein
VLAATQFSSCQKGWSRDVLVDQSREHRHQHRLDGVDRDWHATRPRRQADGPLGEPYLPPETSTPPRSPHRGRG